MGIVSALKLKSLLDFLRHGGDLAYKAIGPDRIDKPRWQRPYFVLPLGQDATEADTSDALGRIKHWTQNSSAITDVFIFSHGWHRNYFSAVAAYDRLMSRLRGLLGRDRIGRKLPRDFHPLYVGLHWHSDPGPDLWRDHGGRRNRESFLDQASDLFVPVVGRSFTSDFEDIYKIFADTSSPGTTWKQGHYTGLESQVSSILDHYELNDARDASMAEKISAVWRCYFEATARGVLLDQGTKPGSSTSLKGTLISLIPVLVSVLGIEELARLVITGGWSRIVSPLTHLESWVSVRLDIPDWIAWPITYAGIAVIAWILLFIARGFHKSSRHRIVVKTTPEGKLERIQKKDLTGSGNVFIAAVVCVCWLWLFLPALAVLLVVLLAGFLPAQVLGARRTLLFAERFGRPSAPPPEGEYKKHRLLLEWIALVPRICTQQAAAALSIDTPLERLLRNVDSFLAFWEMQRRAVQVGAEAASLLVELIPRGSGENPVRIHLIGHSFGGLVVSNLARSLAPKLDESTRQVATLCLLQPAMRSDWFDGDTTVLNAVKKSIICVYSRYDTANGFYYPLANHGRLSAGYVGLYGGSTNFNEPMLELKAGKFVSHHRGGSEWATLVMPPNYDVPLGELAIVNVDASRSIYDGKAASGGGHNDIFKDDVVHMIWGAVRLAWAPKLAQKQLATVPGAHP